jgi:hypothetical protein
MPKRSCAGWVSACEHLRNFTDSVGSRLMGWLFAKGPCNEAN